MGNVNSTVQITAHTTRQRSLNVALETVFEFNNKDRRTDINLINNVQNFLNKVKGALYKSQGRSMGVKTLDDYADDDENDETVEKKQATTPNDITFTGFLKTGIDILKKFPDEDLENVFYLLDTETRKFYEQGHKFSELVQNRNLRRFMSKRMEEIKQTRADKIRKILDNSAKMLYLMSTIDRFADVLEFVDSLYDTTESKMKMYTFLRNLKLYTAGSKRNLNDLTKIVKNGVRDVLVDRYARLSLKQRKVLKVKLDSLWEIAMQMGVVNTKKETVVKPPRYPLRYQTHRDTNMYPKLRPDNFLNPAEDRLDKANMLPFVHYDGTDKKKKKRKSKRSKRKRKNKLLRLKPDDIEDNYRELPSNYKDSGAEVRDKKRKYPEVKDLFDRLILQNLFGQPESGIKTANKYYKRAREEKTNETLKTTRHKGKEVTNKANIIHEKVTHHLKKTHGYSSKPYTSHQTRNKPVEDIHKDNSTVEVQRRHQDMTYVTPITEVTPDRSVEIKKIYNKRIGHLEKELNRIKNEFNEIKTRDIGQTTTQIYKQIAQDVPGKIVVRAQQNEVPEASINVVRRTHHHESRLSKVISRDAVNIEQQVKSRDTARDKYDNGQQDKYRNKEGASYDEGQQGKPRDSKRGKSAEQQDKSEDIASPTSVEAEQNKFREIVPAPHDDELLDKPVDIPKKTQHRHHHRAHGKSNRLAKTTHHHDLVQDNLSDAAIRSDLFGPIDNLEVDKISNEEGQQDKFKDVAKKTHNQEKVNSRDEKRDHHHEVHDNSKNVGKKIRLREEQLVQDNPSDAVIKTDTYGERDKSREVARVTYDEGQQDNSRDAAMETRPPDKEKREQRHIERDKSRNVAKQLAKQTKNHDVQSVQDNLSEEAIRADSHGVQDNHKFDARITSDEEETDNSRNVATATHDDVQPDNLRGEVKKHHHDVKLVKPRDDEKRGHRQEIHDKSKNTDKRAPPLERLVQDIPSNEANKTPYGLHDKPRNVARVHDEGLPDKYKKIARTKTDDNLQALSFRDVVKKPKKEKVQLTKPKEEAKRVRHRGARDKSRNVDKKKNKHDVQSVEDNPSEETNKIYENGLRDKSKEVAKTTNDDEHLDISGDITRTTVYQHDKSEEVSESTYYDDRKGKSRYVTKSNSKDVARITYEDEHQDNTDDIKKTYDDKHHDLSEDVERTTYDNRNQDQSGDVTKTTNDGEHQNISGDVVSTTYDDRLQDKSVEISRTPYDDEHQAKFENIEKTRYGDRQHDQSDDVPRTTNTEEQHDISGDQTQTTYGQQYKSGEEARIPYINEQQDKSGEGRTTPQGDEQQEKSIESTKRAEVHMKTDKPRNTVKIGIVVKKNHYRGEQPVQKKPSGPVKKTYHHRVSGKSRNVAKGTRNKHPVQIVPRDGVKRPEHGKQSTQDKDSKEIKLVKRAEYDGEKKKQDKSKATKKSVRYSRGGSKRSRGNGEQTKSIANTTAADEQTSKSKDDTKTTPSGDQFKDIPMITYDDGDEDKHRIVLNIPNVVFTSFTKVKKTPKTKLTTPSIVPKPSKEVNVTGPLKDEEQRKSFGQITTQTVKPNDNLANSTASISETTANSTTSKIPNELPSLLPLIVENLNLTNNAAVRRYLESRHLSNGI